MSPDPPSSAPAGIAQADPLYQSFPDFSAWGRLAPADTDLWDRFAASLNERRKSATPEALWAAVEVAVRAAALDTGALEGLYAVDRGFTMTVAFQSLAWEQAIEERGAGVRELFEAQLEAYELVLDAVTKDRPITEMWIRNLHEKLCAPQKTYPVRTEVGRQEQELPKGQYKILPNHPLLHDGTFHAYAPVDRVPDEMHRLVQQLRTTEFQAAHPILQASYCHYAFVVIHPFADGNGRVARALASTFFYRAQSIPLVIFANQRPAYLDALHAADLGDFRPVISFFGDRGIDTMQLVADSLLTAGMPRPEDLATRISGLTGRKRDLSLEEIEAVARRLLREIDGQFRSQISNFDLTSISFETFAYPTMDPPFGYWSAVQDRKTLGYRLRSLGASIATTSVRVLFTKDPENPFPFLVQANEGDADALEIRLEDVRPELSSNLKLRLSNWVQRRLTDMLRNLERQLEP